MDIDKDKLLNKIIDIKSTFNIDVIFCPKTLFSLDGLKSNIGSYILLGNIVTPIICGIFFYIKSFNKIVNLVSSILKIKKNEKIYNKEEGNKNSKEKENISNINDNLILRDAKMDNKIKDSKDKISNSKIDINYNPPNRRNNKKEKINSTINLNFSENRTFINSKTPCDMKLKNSITLNDNILDISKNESQKNIYQLTDNKLLNYTDNEMNSLSYNEALKIDKRTYFQYYLSLLKTKHLLIFTFYTKNDYNSFVIKISLFYFSFSLLITVNSLFFQDSTMHKIYEDNGLFDFLYQIPNILYSTIISSLLNIISKRLSLTEKDIIKVKNDKDANDSFENITNITKYIFLKTFLFFILIFIFLGLFWYYLSNFCAVFTNTQKPLLKNSLISFGISLVYPFGLNLIPGLFRIPSLKSKKKRPKYIIYYK